jgi:hypothetical protein
MDAFIKPVILSCPDSVQCELHQSFQGVSSLEVFRLIFSLLNETGEAAVSCSKRILLYGGIWLVINLYFCFDTFIIIIIIIIIIISAFRALPFSLFAILVSRM